MSSSDPTMVAFAVHAERVLVLMEAGHLDRHAALAALVADALAASVDERTAPEASDELLMMATTWATVRARGLAGDVLLSETPVPDDVRDLGAGDT